MIDSLLSMCKALPGFDPNHQKEKPLLRKTFSAYGGKLATPIVINSHCCINKHCGQNTAISGYTNIKITHLAS